MYSEYREYVRQFRRSKVKPMPYKEYLLRRSSNHQQSSSQRSTQESSLKLQSF